MDMGELDEQIANFVKSISCKQKSNETRMQTISSTLSDSMVATHTAATMAIDHTSADTATHTLEDTAMAVNF